MRKQRDIPDYLDFDKVDEAAPFDKKPDPKIRKEESFFSELGNGLEALVGLVLDFFSIFG
jgi:hypothetical protein